MSLSVLPMQAENEGVDQYSDLYYIFNNWIFDGELSVCTFLGACAQA